VIRKYSSQPNSFFRTALLLIVGSLFITISQASGDDARPIVDADGTVHFPAMSIPLSSLESDEAKRNFLDIVHGCPSSPGEKEIGFGHLDDISAVRKKLDDCLMKPGVEKLRAVFPVTIKSEMMGGIQTDVITPAGGIAKRTGDAC